MTLRAYIIRKVFLLVPVLFAISVITFIICHVAPGSPIELLMGVVNPEVSPEIIHRVEEQLGLHQPLWVQYFIWLRELVTGSFGYSYVSCLPVSRLIGERIVNTLKLTVTSLIISVAFSVILGTIAAVKSRTIADYLATTTSLLGISMPVYWIGIVLIIVFSLRLGVFPSSGVQTLGVEMSWSESLIDQIWHMMLPVAVLSFSSVAYNTRLLKASMQNILNQDYITTARAKGLKERAVIYKHAVRNALLPLVTAIGTMAGFLLSGAVLVETIFAWPGLGRLIIEAAMLRDYPVIMAANMIIATMVIVANLITDILYAFLDPRIRY